MKRTIVLVFPCVVFLLLTLASAKADTCGDVPKNFLELADLRGKLRNEVPDLEEVVRELPKKIKDAKSAESDLQDAQKKLKALQDKTPRTTSEDQQVTSLQTLIVSIQKGLGGNSSVEYEAELAKIQNQLTEKTKQLQCTEEQISSIFSPEQKFKTIMSIAFSILIGLVISGFFFLAIRYPQIGQAVFSGQAGLQFLTLFSLVIAIILFGITNILQDKELAALLGGLSGYILGRYNQPNQPESNGPVPLAPRPAAPNTAVVPPPGLSADNAAEPHAPDPPPDNGLEPPAHGSVADNAPVPETRGLATDNAVPPPAVPTEDPNPETK